MSQKAAKRDRKQAKELVVRVAKSQPDLVAHLRDQVEFLRGSAARFDEGSEREAKLIAVAVRVLVHDTSSSKSLLGQLGLKDILTYYDTGDVLITGNFLPTLGLFRVNQRIRGDHQRASYDARLDDLADPGSWVSFERWWRRTVSQVPLADWNISREEYVLAVANNEGGAHVDPFFSPLYTALARENAFGWIHERVKNGVEESSPPENDPVFAAVRQIGHEIIRTLERHVPALLADD